MGFSVSGSAAILFVGAFIAFGMFHSATTNSFERVSEAQDDRADDALAQQNTDVEIVNASYGTTTTTSGSTFYLLDVNTTNTGSESLSVGDTDLLIDNDYRTGWESAATVDGDNGTDLWLSGEKLAVEFNESSPPDRVKVVTETGVSATAEVTQSG
jgi:flagellar protein FlaF